MEKYPSNSMKSKKKAEEVSIEKADAKDISTKDARLQIIEDDASGIKTYFINEIYEGVIKPSAKKTFMDISRAILDGIHDTIDDGLSALIHEEPSGSSRRRHASSYSRSSYQDYYDRKNSRSGYSERKTSLRNARSAFDYQEVLFSDREEAKDALDRLFDLLEENGVVSVMDLYYCAGIKSDVYTYTKYGWIDLSSAKIQPVQGGYTIKLARPQYID